MKTFTVLNSAYAGNQRVVFSIIHFFVSTTTKAQMIQQSPIIFCANAQTGQYLLPIINVILIPLIVGHETVWSC